jgi:hypothetical protein
VAPTTYQIVPKFLNQALNLPTLDLVNFTSA